MTTNFFPSLGIANSVAKTASKVQPLTVSVYQVGAATFAVQYDYQPAPDRGLLIGQFKNGQPAAPSIA